MKILIGQQPLSNSLFSDLLLAYGGGYANIGDQGYGQNYGQGYDQQQHYGYGVGAGYTPVQQSNQHRFGSVYSQHQQGYNGGAGGAAAGGGGGGGTHNSGFQGQAGGHSSSLRQTSSAGQRGNWNDASGASLR